LNRWRKSGGQVGIRKQSMKKLVLIGESIRMGYAQYVTEELGEEAIVWWPEDNCRHADVII
jgi:hypothetical protein